MPYVRTLLRGALVAALALTLNASLGVAAHAAPSKADLEKKIDTASNKLEDIVESYNKMNLDLKATKTAEKDLAASLPTARKQLVIVSDQVGQIAASAYRSGQLSELNMVLDDAGPGTLLDRLGMLDQVTRTRQRQIEQFTETTQQYTAKQTALRLTQTKQAAQVKELANRKEKIQGDLDNLYAMRTAAFGSASEQGTPYTGKIPSISGSAGIAVRFAFNQIGKPYVFGADGPGSYDCSGLTSAAWDAAGKSLPHNAAAQYGTVTHISRSDLRPGDLIFYRNLAHVGIYVGDGQIIDASRPGKPVRKRTMDILPPYGYGRIT